MEPNIKSGEFVVIKKDRDYNIGDIVTYEENDFLVTHRIVNKWDSSFIAKGDANNENDEVKESSKILGQVIFNSILIGKFLRVYLKYIFFIFTIFVVLKNIYWLQKNRESEVKSKECGKQIKTKEIE